MEDIVLIDSSINAELFYFFTGRSRQKNSR